MLKFGHFRKLALLVIFVFLAVLILGCTPQETLEAPVVEEPAAEEPAEEPAVEEPVAEEPVAEEPAEEPAAEEPATEEPVEEPAVEETSITILIPDNPVAFNGLNTDTANYYIDPAAPINAKYARSNNFVDDPRFVGGSLRLAPHSPCRDPQGLFNITGVDILGHPRDSRPDYGAREYLEDALERVRRRR